MSAAAADRPVYPHASMQFGVTVLPDPPWQRLVELIRLAEQNGFDYGWTYDSMSSGRSRTRSSRWPR